MPKKKHWYTSKFTKGFLNDTRLKCFNTHFKTKIKFKNWVTLQKQCI